jgi:hypothetical protein
MWAMNLDIDEPICVIDIDIILINDYKKLFDFPILPGQFVLFLVGGETQKKKAIE